MGKPYSMDLRERAVAAVVSGGLSCRRAAKQFGLGVNTIITWVRRLRQTGSVAPGKMGGHWPKGISGEHRIWLLHRIKDGDFTLRGLVAELGARGLKVDYRSVWEFIHAEKLSFKKSVVAGERDRPDMARRRARWIKYQDHVDPARLVFIDETWSKTNMALLRGFRTAWNAARDPGSVRPLDHDDVPGRAAPRPDRSTLASRRSNRRRELCDLR